MEKSKKNTKNETDSNEKIKDKNEKDKDKKVEIGLKIGEMTTNTGLKIFEKLFDFFTAKEKYKHSESSSQYELLKQNNDENKKMIKELEELVKKMVEEKNQNKPDIVNGTKEWDETKNKIIDSMFAHIDLTTIKKTIIKDNLKTLENELIMELDKILNVKLKNCSFIQEKHDSIFKDIKGDIKQVKSYNFILIGFTGAGKSCLTNAILNKKLAKEGESINPQTDKITQYYNELEPGITIYDTIGIESTSIERGLSEIKKMVENTFIENLDNPEKSLHGILYCINNGSSSHKIEKGEIDFILELNRLYGENDILTIVFTQSLHEKTQERIKQLKEALNNDKIDIIPVIAKEVKIKAGSFEITIPTKGIPQLKEVMKIKCRNKLVKCNLKQIIKKKIKDKYEKIIEEDYDKLEKKIKSNEFEKSLKDECDLITKTLLGRLDINFGKMEDILDKFINKEKMNEIKKKLFEKNKSDFFSELYEEFNVINEKYGNKLNSFSHKEITKKFDDYFKNNIIKYINDIYFENASLIIMKKLKEFFGEIISDNIKDEDIDDLVNSNLNNIIKT